MSLPSRIRPSVLSDDLSVSGMPPQVIPETPPYLRLRLPGHVRPVSGQFTVIPEPLPLCLRICLPGHVRPVSGRTAASLRVRGRFAAPTDVHQKFKELLLFVYGGRNERPSNSEGTAAKRRVDDSLYVP
ncbi:hypothetical protein CDAR_479811 [Caerostris darwini]|uniref:Uncharacterized protein n=1 Tax=Caerostris darwini TaxID=1538125 RepID=A0AAV4SPV5_9ARAC|nr:hypothetical protein CDAR_479811 [Caerostris darwini]